MASFEHELPASTSQAELLALRRPAQRATRGRTASSCSSRCPAHIDPQRCIEAIDPAKDVDGFHPLNAGRLAAGRTGAGALHALGLSHSRQSGAADLAGLEAVVIGRSNIVGKPMAQLLLRRAARSPLAHSQDARPSRGRAAGRHPVAAVGRPEMVRGDWIKPGATVIDVGINRLPTAARASEARRRRGLCGGPRGGRRITPVPGGVGPMTIACLLRNTLEAARILAEP